jgi:hypothetical protein
MIHFLTARQAFVLDALASMSSFGHLLRPAPARSRFDFVESRSEHAFVA